MTPITTELLETIYTRAYQYACTRWGAPDDINLEDGNIIAVYVSYCGGDRDVEAYSFTADALSEDLDEVAAKRKEEEAAAEAKRIQEVKKREEANRKAQEQKDYNTYLQLRNRFEKKG